ncbi:MAG: DUF748 domain-containing protein [Gammaproteobacteria bacterium]
MLKKILILSAILLTLVGLYTAAGFLLVPKLAEKHLPKLLSEMTGESVRVQSVHFDPFDWKAELQGVSLLLENDRSLLSLDELAVDIDVLDSIKNRAVIVKSALLRQPVIAVQRDHDGRFNFDAVVENVTQTDEQSSPQPSESVNVPLIVVRQFAIEQGQVDWSDVQAGQAETESLQAVDFSMTEFSTVPDTSAEFTISLKLKSGGGLDMQGRFNLSALSSEGHLKLSNLALRKVWSLFLQEAMPLEISDGYTSLNAAYRLDAAGEAGLQFVVDDGNLDIRQFAVTEKEKSDPLISVPFFDVDGIRVDLQKQQIDIKEVSSRNADIRVWLQTDGQVNYQTLFAAGQTSAEQERNGAASETAEPSPPWQIKLNELDLDQYRIAFTDYSQTKPVDMVLDQLNLNLHDYRNTDAIKLPLQFDGRFNDIGHIKLDGDFGLSPFTVNFAVELQEVKLKTFQSYLDRFLGLELADGNFNTKGNLQIDGTQAMQIKYQGEASIGHLITRDKVKNIDFVKWSNLALKKLDIDVAKQHYTIGEVSFEQPYVRFNIKKDGTNNVNDILVVKTASKSESASPKQIGPENRVEPVISIGKIRFNKGESDFADYSLILPFVVRMNDLAGEVDGFTSSTDAAAKLKLTGKVLDLAAVNIGGSYQFKSGDSNIALSFKHLPLPLVTPYMAEFAGYKIEKGQMALDLKYSIKKGELSAQNKIFIDQLVLGEQVENPKAVSLPLELGVALLKDRDGKINLDFPITGSLENPEFSVGSMIGDVLVNLITKTVSAPFNAIASLFDSDEDLSTVGFAAGSAELSDTEQAKLAHVAEALAAKPKLVLEIKGVSYEQLDWPVMRSGALTDILKKMKSGELRDKGEKIRSEYIELSDDEYRRLLAKFFAEVFPLKIEYSLFGSPRIKEKPDADFYKIARQELEAVMNPDSERLDELAVSRANAIAKYLTEQGSVDRSRIYILATELNKTEADGGINVQLSLNVAS